MNSLEASIRNTKTKGEVNRLRHMGEVPAIIYGGREENQKIKDEAIGLANLVLSSMDLLMTCNDAAKVTLWPGRMQLIQYSKEVEILLDCAHNPSGMFRAFEEISKYYVGVETLILGCTKQTNLHLFFLKILTAFVISFIVHIPVDINVFFFCLATDSRSGKFVIIAEAILLYLKLNFFIKLTLLISQQETNRPMLICLQNFTNFLYLSILNSIFFL